jgi:hypothetical protein
MYLTEKGEERQSNMDDQGHYGGGEEKEEAVEKGKKWGQHGRIQGSGQHCVKDDT